VIDIFNVPFAAKKYFLSMHPPISSDRTLAGIGLMLGAMFLFSINDVMGKWLVATYGVAQILLIRSFAAGIMLAPAVRRVGFRAILVRERPWLHICRAICSTAEVAFFYWAVMYLPLADTVAFYLAGPIFVTFFAIVFLKEHVSWRHWLAIVIGFVGVLLAVGPTGEGYGWAVLIPIGGTLLFAGLNIFTRRLAGTDEVALVTWQVASAFLFGLVIAPFFWVQPSLFDFLCLCLLGIVSALAHMGVNRALRYAPAAVVVPYQYTLIVWAVLLGFLFFGDVPAWSVVMGSIIIVASGLYIFMHEQVKTPGQAAEQP
jgi:drug/metabolite transporter (DMT)-like permease